MQGTQITASKGYRRFMRRHSFRRWSGIASPAAQVLNRSTQESYYSLLIFISFVSLGTLNEINKKRKKIPLGYCG